MRHKKTALKGPFLKGVPFHLTILAGLLTVFFVLAPMGRILSVGLILNYFSTAPLFLVGFSLGLPNVLIALSIVIPLLFLIGGVTATMIFLTLQVIPLLVIIYLALEKTRGGWKPLTYILGAMTALAIVGVTLFFLWLGLVHHQTLDGLVKVWLESIPKTQDLMQAHTANYEALQRIVKFFPSLFGMSCIFVLVINALICLQILQSKKLTPRPYPIKTDFKALQGWDIPFFIGLLATLTPYPLLAAWGANVMLLSALPLFLVGLRLLYLGFIQLNVARIWFFVMLCFTLLLAWPLLFVVALGIVEPLLQLSQRLKK